jgi:hypothetical protein
MIQELFNYIPAPWRPHIAILLLILYVITKARSEVKNKQIKTLQYQITQIQQHPDNKYYTHPEVLRNINPPPNKIKDIILTPFRIFC